MVLITSLIILSILLHGKLYAAETIPEYVKLFSVASDQDSSSGSASYDCIFTNLWTKSRHPSNYPNDAHWSPPVVVSHDLGYSIFKEGWASTEGLESVAETGSTKKILDEIADAGDAVFDKKVGSGMDGKQFTASQKIMNVGLDNSHPYLSMVTMVAPSPDWFTGLNDFDMRDTDSGNWLQEVTLDLFPWDSGTDSGTSYNSPNGNSNESVYQLTINTIPETKVFESPDGATVLPVGRFQCQLNGMKATSCKREISESCNKKNKTCCPGLVCMRSNNPTATGGKKKKKKKKKACLPLRYEGERCKKNSDCVSGLDCVNKSCS